MSASYLGALFRREPGHDFSLPQGAFTFLGRQAVKLTQPFFEFSLVLGRKLLEPRVIFQGLFLLVWRKVIVGFKPKPVTHFGCTGFVPFLWLRMGGIPPVAGLL